MASVPIEGGLYSRYLAKQRKAQTEEKSGTAVISKSELLNRPAKNNLIATLASPRARFLNLFNVSYCSPDKMTTDLDFNIKDGVECIDGKSFCEVFLRLFGFSCITNCLYAIVHL